MTPPQPLRIPFDTALDSHLSSESTIAEKLLQITNQTGPFRHLTEQRILDEDSGYDAGAPERQTALEKTEDAVQQRLEKLWASKESITKEWSRGLDELLTSLDFLSLLISKQSAAARAGISEGLQAQKVPAGSLEAKVVQAQTPLTATVKRDAQVARGWKAKGFESAHAKFTAASERLKTEAEREALFWAETARLQEDGWKISRHPRDSKAIGIHIGMDASAPHFKTRGFDILRQDDDGTVYLNQSAVSSSRKKLQIAIERHGRISGSAISNVTATATSSRTSESAALARDSLLEEELFHEASREALLLSNQDVTTRAQAIVFNLDQESKVILSYSTVGAHTALQTQNDDAIAHGIQICLKSSFIEALEHRQQSRMKKPSPITTRPRPTPELSILRPLITTMRHRLTIYSLQKQFLVLFREPFQQAGLSLGFETLPISRGNGQINGDVKLPTLLSNSNSNGLLLKLPGGKTVSIQIESSLDAPIYGTRYETDSVDFGYAKVARLSLNSEDTFLEAVRRILGLSVVNVITTASTPVGNWEVKMAQKGEMAFIRSGGEKRISALRARIQVLRGTVSLSVSAHAKDLEAGRAGVAVWSWSARRTTVAGNTEDVGIPGQQADKLSLLEVVSQLTSHLSQG
ncbi:hypothetical protein DV738_g2560, partial [Chaetothyriales sp. CBS 135597]